MPRPLRILAYLLGVPLALLALTLAVLYAMSPSQAGRPLAQSLGIAHRAVIAHRGLSQAAPESTAPAYLLARELGADYLELDVQRTRDQVLIALHDDTLERTSNVAQVFPDRAARGADAFTWAELQTLDAGSWFNQASPARARPSYTKGLRLQTLDDVLHIAAGGHHRPGIYLETKSAERYPGYEQQIVALLRTRGWIGTAAARQGPPDAYAALPEAGTPAVQVAAGPARVVFQSFVPESLAELRRLAPEVPRVLLIDSDSVQRMGWQHYLDMATRLDAGLGIAGYEGWPWYVGPAHRAGRLVHAYTLNVPWQVQLLTYFGVDGVFTDAADMGLRTVGRQAPDRAALLQRLGY